MNRKIILYTLGIVCMAESGLMLVPIICALFYQEQEGVAYVFTAGITFILGYALGHKKPENTMFYLKEGCIATALSWIVLSLIGAVPFVLTGEIPYYPDALFETVSGFTTTGASILGNVEALSHCSIMWRSFTHWIGGMGVLVFLLAIIPLSGGSTINLMRAESPGPSVGKFSPHLKQTARVLYLIYVALTVFEFLVLIISGMPFFDAINISFGTAGTGGFAIRNSGFAEYTFAQQWIVTIFMIIFGVNFNFYYLLLVRDIKDALRMEEVKAYFGIIIASTVIITLNILPVYHNVSLAVKDAAFQVGSIITTTGFATTDFNVWPTLSKTILVTLMFIGACAGSTGGGIKVSRIIITLKAFVRESNSYIHPKSVKNVNMDGKPLDENNVRSVNVYMSTFTLIFVISVLLVSIEGRDFTTNFTAVAATINNIGPGLGDVGPASNFESFSTFSKFVMIFDMLFGRLEFFPLIVLFHPTVWKEMHEDIRAAKKRRRIKVSTKVVQKKYEHDAKKM